MTVSEASPCPAQRPAADASPGGVHTGLDWRFLLGVARLGRVALVGPHDDAEVAALGEHAETVDRYRSVTTLGDSVAAYDVVSARDVPAGAAALLLFEMRPGGWLHVQPTSSRAAVRWAAALRRLGEVPTSVWHAPSAAARSYLVPLDTGGGVRHVLTRYDGVRADQARASAARLALRLGARRVVLRDRSVVAHRADERAQDLVRGYLARQDGNRLPEWTAAAGLAPVYLTPKFPSSRHVIAMLVEAGSGRPRLVAKLPRHPGDRGPIEREARLLRHLPTTAPAPALIALDEHDGQPLLLQSVVTGRPLSPRQVRRDPGEAIALGLELLRRLPVTRTTSNDPGWWDRLLAEPLTGFADLQPDERPLVERTLRALAPLRGAVLPLVVEHGDLSHPNLLVRDGRLHAVDWELGEMSGLPGHDLTFFLQYVAEARDGTATPAQQCAVFDSAFLTRSGWARTALTRYLRNLSVDEELLPALVVASWARRATARVASVTSPDLPPRGRPLDPLVGVRELMLWRYAVRHLDC
jgi:predicted Ser/Thr protein kinase